MTVTARFCPNCGAPLQLVGNRCRFCEVPIEVLAEPAAPGVPAPMAPPVEAAPVDPDAPFALTVDDTFFIKKRGLVVTGRIESGTIRVGDAVRIDGASGTRSTTCTGVEMFRKTLDQATAGDRVGLRLDVLDKDQVSAGDRITHA
jgi:elongation factor Tu